MSRQVFGFCVSLGVEERSLTFRLLEAVSRILVPVQGDFLEGAGVREGADTCQASCAQQQLEGSALRSVTSPPSVKTDLSSGWRYLGVREGRKQAPWPQRVCPGRCWDLVWGIDCAFPEPLLCISH